MAVTVDWILVADRARARVFHALLDAQGPFPVLAVLVHAAGRLQRHEMESDSPGTVMHPSGVLSGIEPHEDVAHRESRKFAAQICEHLDRACLENRFDRLIVVAPPDFLGVLREQWTARIQSRIAYELHKELAGFSDTQIQPRLVEILEAVPA